MSDGRRIYARLRSVLEVPILNEKYWSKIPTVAADAILIDLEDSATPNTKDAARDRTVAALADPGYFGGRSIIVRVNNLATPWGRDDLAALANAPGEFLVCYPKIETVDELVEARRLLEGSGNQHGLHVMIETARAMIELDRIAGADGVAGLHFGYVDYAADVGSRPFDERGDDLWAPANHYARTKIAVAAAAYGLFCTGGTLIPEYRDLDKVRTFARGWRDLGYTALIAVSPAHLDIVNEAMSPSPDEIERARQVCRIYQEAVDKGQPAAVLDGKVITSPDYRVAELVLARAGVS